MTISNRARAMHTRTEICSKGEIIYFVTAAAVVGSGSSPNLNDTRSIIFAVRRSRPSTAAKSRNCMPFPSGPSSLQTPNFLSFPNPSPAFFPAAAEALSLPDAPPRSAFVDPLNALGFLDGGVGLKGFDGSGAAPPDIQLYLFAFLPKPNCIAAVTFAFLWRTSSVWPALAARSRSFLVRGLSGAMLPETAGESVPPGAADGVVGAGVEGVPAPLLVAAEAGSAAAFRRAARSARRLIRCDSAECSETASEER